MGWPWIFLKKLKKELQYHQTHHQIFPFFFRNHSGHSIMPGNTNTYVANINEIVPPIVASKVRFVPHSNHKRTVCMRVEVFGCLYEDGVVSYSAPPGDEFAPNFYLEDVYDGKEEHMDENAVEGPRLINGLGLLSDGMMGSNVSFSENGLSSGKQKRDD